MDGIIYRTAGDVVVPLGLAENVEELHKFLYPNETKTVSSTVQMISTEISNLTNVVRPANMNTEEETNTDNNSNSNNNNNSNKPVITNSTSDSGNSKSNNNTTGGGTE